MLGEKRILWILVRARPRRHHARGAARAPAAQRSCRRQGQGDKARKAKLQVVVDDEPDEKPAPPKKVPKATVLSPETKTYLAEQDLHLRAAQCLSVAQPAARDARDQQRAANRNSPPSPATICPPLTRLRGSPCFSPGSYRAIQAKPPTLSSRPKVSKLPRR